MSYTIGNYDYAMLAHSSQQTDDTVFRGKTGNMSIIDVVERSKNYAKAMMLSTCLVAGAACSNSTDASTIPQTDTVTLNDSNNVVCLNVKPEVRDVVVNTLSKYRRSLRKDKDFLQDVEVVVVDNFKNLDMTNQFYKQISSSSNSHKTMGISYYSDTALKKQIVIQQDAHKNSIFFNRGFNENKLKHSLMHEVGHQFDSYFGHEHDAEYAKKWNEIVAEMDANPEKNPYEKPKGSEEIMASAIYHKYNGLSDKPNFQEAMVKDLQHIAEVKKENSSDLPSNLSYFTRKVDLSKEITAEVVDMADFCRSEVYANLFSYANGQDDGNKEKFIKAFANSYQVVQNDIKELLK